ncbi:MAG: EAL domain-containing protein [bacterium]|nr:EAL domain-containing protein [bacterium]
MLVSTTPVSRVLRVAAISAAYLVAWIGLDLLATVYGGNNGGLFPWYFGAALTFYLAYTFGLRYAVLGVVAELLRPLLFPPVQLHHVPSEYYLLFGVVDAGGYALTAWFLRDVARVRLPLVGFRDASLFCATMAWVPLALSVPLVALTAAFGRTEWAQYFSQLITFWIGDCVGLVVAVPVLALYLTPRVAPQRVSPEALQVPVPLGSVERFWLFAFLVGSIVVGYATVPLKISNDPILFFTFLPLMMLAARGGLRLAIPAIVVADVAMTTVNALLHVRSPDAVALQSYVIVSAMAAILLGAIVDSRYRKEQRNRRLASTDPLTGLPNRIGLERWIAQAPSPLVLVMIDVDRFRLTNDGLSRAAGDTLLRAIARRLQGSSASFVAHITADEFVCAFLAPTLAPTAIAKDIAAHFERPFDAGEAEVYLSVSLGVAGAECDDDRAALLRHASIAMYRAKKGGRGRSAIYSDEMASDVGDISLAAELFAALEGAQLELFYQPIVRCDGDDRACIGAEALLRWNHPRLGLLAPNQFLELLESLTLADRVGAWVIAEAVRQVRAWRDDGLDLQVWINLFPRQALDRETGAHIARALERHAIPADRVVVEITERVFVEDEEEIATAIRALAALGVRTAIDDFGTGHSSLGRLRDVSAHYLKIDRSFINDSEVNAKSRSMVQAVLNLAQELQIVPLAEGIENRSQLDLVRGFGCRLAQGYFLGLPMRAADLEEWLAAVTVN